MINSVAAPKKWTVLLYSAADNNLHPFMVDDVHEMESVGSDDQTNLCVQIDHGRDNDLKGCQRTLLQKGGSPIEKDLGQVDMASAYTLADSIKWAMTKYPAEHTMLIVSDHGNSWKGCCQDDSSLSWMDLPALKSALTIAREATGKKLDVIGFDACLMANTEVATQLKDQADYLIASEQTEGGDGWPYAPILGPQVLREVQRSLRERIDLEPAELARLVVRKAAERPEVIHTLSAVDLSKMGAVQDAITDLRAALVGSDATQETLRDIMKKCRRFFGYRDLGHWLQLMKADDRIAPEVKVNLGNVEAAYRSAVVAEQHAPDFENSSGLTIQLTRPNDYNTYMQLDFEHATDWVQLCNKMGPP